MAALTIRPPGGYHHRVIRRLGFQATRQFIRFVRHQSVDLRLFGGERLNEHGPMLLAPTHMGHLEGLLLSGHVRRPIHWVMRSSLLRPPPWAWFLRQAGAVSIDPNGVCTSSIRQCLNLLAAGRAVGIFPEGRVTRGPTAAAFGAPVFGGAALIALRSGVPIVPIVVLGMEKLNELESWIPGRRSPIGIGVGRPIDPPPLPRRPQRREARRALNRALQTGYQATYADLARSLAEPGKLTL